MAQRTTPPGRRRSGVGGSVVLLLLVAVFVVAAWPSLRPSLRRGVTVRHVVTPDLCTAEMIARHYGWTGDWREYETEMERLNGWHRWPTLYVGQTVTLRDYREKE